MQKNESVDNRISENQELFENLTKVAFGCPFGMREYVVYRTTKDRNLKDLIDYKLSYITSKDKSGNFKNMIEEFRKKFDVDLPTKGLEDDEI